ncbi:hypothetical protein KA525_04635 [Candidatus Woesebacteria bacterium]|nr:hypothetical protein [Candidatus Woesebacteria bacterium]
MSNNLKTTLNQFFTAFRLEIAEAGEALHKQNFEVFERVVNKIQNSKLTSLITVQARSSSDQFEEEITNSLDRVTTPNSSKLKSLITMLLGGLAIAVGVMGSLGTMLALILVVVGVFVLFKGLKGFSDVDNVGGFIDKVITQ